MNDKIINDFEKEVRLLTLRLSIPTLKKFTEYILFEKFPITDDNHNNYIRNVNMAKFMIHYLKERVMYNEIKPNKQTDAAIMGILLHNVCFDGDEANWRDVFKFREELLKDNNIFDYDTIETHDVIEYVCQIIEAQLGEKMPIIQCRPMSGQITYIVWEVIFMYKQFVDGRYITHFQSDENEFTDILKNVFNIELDENNNIVENV